MDDDATQPVGGTAPQAGAALRSGAWLVAESVSLARGGRRAVDGVSLSVRPGELLAVVGENGAGKSTLLGLLAGELRPDAGRVVCDGVDLARVGAAPLARKRAVMAQDSSIAFDFTADEVVLLGRYPHNGGIAGPADRRIADICLVLAGAAALRERAVTALSGGERARVQLARAFAQVFEWQPEAARYLLLDEPAASLDLAHQYATFAVLRRVAREQKLGIVATVHDLNLAARFADRVLVLARGKALYQGSPRDCFTRARVVEAFGLDVDVLEHPAGGPLVVPRVPRTLPAV